MNVICLFVYMKSEFIYRLLDSFYQRFKCWFILFSFHLLHLQPFKAEGLQYMDVMDLTDPNRSAEENL